MKFLGVQNATFDENPHENARIRVILGRALSTIARAKHRCTGGWLILWCQIWKESKQNCRIFLQDESRKDCEICKILKF